MAIVCGISKNWTKNLDFINRNIEEFVLTKDISFTMVFLMVMKKYTVIDEIIEKQQPWLAYG